MTFTPTPKLLEQAKEALLTVFYDCHECTFGQVVTAAEGFNTDDFISEMVQYVKLRPKNPARLNSFQIQVRRPGEITTAKTLIEALGTISLGGDCSIWINNRKFFAVHEGQWYPTCGFPLSAVAAATGSLVIVDPETAYGQWYYPDGTFGGALHFHLVPFARHRELTIVDGREPLHIMLASFDGAHELLAGIPDALRSLGILVDAQFEHPQ